MRLLDVLVHAAPLREDSIAELAGEILPIVKGFPMHLAMNNFVNCTVSTIKVALPYYSPRRLQ